MEKKKFGVLMADVSQSPQEMADDIDQAMRKILAAYPEMEDCIFTIPKSIELKYDRIAYLIRYFDIADILFCNTCGDEIDHLYRFVRAIAKNAGLEIIAVKDISVDSAKQKEDEV